MSTENSILLNDIIYKLFNTRDQNQLELYITASCNQKCSYCYLYKHGNELYPTELRDFDTIKKNLKLLLEYLGKNNYKFKSIAIFSGEIWETQDGKDILEIIYQYLKKYPFLTSTISLPCNMSFLKNDDDYIYYQDLIDRFNKIFVRLYFSASIDGKYLDELNRSRYDKNNKYTDDFYDRVFTFCAENGFGFHPMVSAINIDKWIPNFNWYMGEFEKYGISSGRIKYLEVRDDNWTDESISQLLKFLNYEIDWLLEHTYKGNLDHMAYDMKAFKGNSLTIPDNILLMDHGNRLTCSIQNAVAVRLGDLSIVPCHRTAYPQFIYGQFKVENNEIIDIEAKNTELAFKIYTMNPEVAQAYCCNCKYNKLCIRGCLGVQYEYNNNLFIPCKSVCKMIKAKTDFLINKYSSLGILDKCCHSAALETIQEDILA